MAIVIEEEKKRGGLLNFLIWLVIIGIIAFATYFIFFKEPEIIEIVLPPEFQDIENISRKQLKPEVIESNSVFNSLKQYITTPTEGESGRANPFLPF